jgi:hypothetical protein
MHIWLQLLRHAFCQGSAAQSLHMACRHHLLCSYISFSANGYASCWHLALQLVDAGSSRRIP